MRNTVFITFHHEKKAELLVNRQFADAVHLALLGFLTVGFGCLKKDMFYAVSEDLPDNGFSLALSAAKDLHLPSDLPFELTYENGFLNIGPCIGLLLSREDNKFKKSRLEKMLSYTHDYPAIHGAIIVFALNQMDMAGKTVTGFCFNPSVQKFERGIYPLPSAVYRTVGLSKAQKEEFRTALNGRYFNSDYFSKWTMYEWLKQN
ncbi:MAG TPA: hypothetical protein VHR42_05195, partial [Clostridia bacterium]|nr:hypothetical protein [Clostridia bacterium]